MKWNENETIERVRDDRSSDNVVQDLKSDKGKARHEREEREKKRKSQRNMIIAIYFAAHLVQKGFHAADRERQADEARSEKRRNDH